MKVGAILQACRERAGFNQTVLAEMLNIQQSDISRIEKNRRGIDSEMLVQWGKVTNSSDVIITYIYGHDGIKTLSKIMETA